MHLDFELSVTNPDGSRSSIRQEEVSTSKKTLGIYNAPGPWLVQGMKSNTLVWVTDGSYDRKRTPLFSKVGWIIFCQDTDKRLVSSF